MKHITIITEQFRVWDAKPFFGGTIENARNHTIANITEIVKCPTKQRLNLANTAVTRNVSLLE